MSAPSSLNEADRGPAAAAVAVTDPLDAHTVRVHLAEDDDVPTSHVAAATTATPAADNHAPRAGLAIDAAAEPPARGQDSTTTEQKQPDESQSSPLPSPLPSPSPENESITPLPEVEPSHEATEVQRLNAKLRGGDCAKGLSTREAEARLLEYGPNELVEKKQHPLLTFLLFFWGPLPWAIEVAAILSAVLASYVDFGIIVALLFINAIIGFVQEHNAGNAIEQIKKNMPRHSHVMRDNIWRSVEISQLMPGDIVMLKIGDMISADGCIVAIDADSPLMVDQSSLTGESRPSKKKMGQTVLSASMIKEGEAEIMVHHTGSNTFIGRAADLVNQSPPSGHFQKILTKISNFLIGSALVCVAIILIHGGIVGTAVLEMVRFCLMLVVVAIPIALPTVLSVTMAIGARLLSQRNAICSRLTAVEELSAVDILCCDKTGTLTKNELSIELPVAFQHHKPDDVVMYATLCSNVHHPDAIDSCMVRAMADRPHLTELMATYKQTELKPFNPIWKRMESKCVNEKDGTTIMLSKGAPQAVFRLLSAETQLKYGGKWKSTIDSFARRGMRALGVTKKIMNDPTKEWELVGLLPIYDPPRDDSAAVIARLKDLGVAVKMLTGDQVEIAIDTCERLGIGTNILNTSVLNPAQRVPSPTQEQKVLKRANSSVLTVMQGGDGVKIVPHEVKQVAHAHRAEELAHAHSDAHADDHDVENPLPPSSPEAAAKAKAINKQAAKDAKKKEKLPYDAALMALVERTNGFGEVFPQHKHQVVKILQHLGHVVGMTGDGVNDAPALKQSNVGIAVSGATDAARAAADVVLLSPGLSVIADSIIESRRIFTRMTAYASYRITSTIQELVFLTIAILAFDFYLSALALVLLAIANDFTVISVAFDRATYKLTPCSWNMKQLIFKCFVMGMWQAGSTFIFYAITDVYFDYDEDIVQTMMFLQISAGSQTSLLSWRVESASLVSHRPSIYVLVSVLGSQLFMTFLSCYGWGLTAIGWTRVGIVWCYVFFMLLGFDTLKQLLHTCMHGAQDEESGDDAHHTSAEQTAIQAVHKAAAEDRKAEDSKQGLESLLARRGSMSLSGKGLQEDGGDESASIEMAFRPATFSGNTSPEAAKPTPVAKEQPETIV